MRRGLLSLLLVILAMLAAVGVAAFEPEEEVDDDLLVEEDEMLEPTDNTDAKPMPEVDPRLTPDVIEMILSKSSAKCRKQVQENPTDASKVSDRCRAEMSSRVQRYLARLDKEESGETEEKKKKKETPKKENKRRKNKKQTRAQRVAAAAQKKEEEYQKTLQTIVGFVVTLVVVIATAMFFINRKLKDAGLYFPDPGAKATCCN